MMGIVLIIGINSLTSSVIKICSSQIIFKISLG